MTGGGAGPTRRSYTEEKNRFCPMERHCVKMRQNALRGFEVIALRLEKR